MPEKPNLQFVIILPVFVTIAFFQPSKFGQISEQKFSRSRITHERGRIANALNIKVFDAPPSKQNNRTEKQTTKFEVKDLLLEIEDLSNAEPPKRPTGTSKISKIRAGKDIFGLLNPDFSL